MMIGAEVCPSAPLIFIGNLFELVSFASPKLLIQTNTAKAIKLKVCQS